jgi:hypothetical protein
MTVSVSVRDLQMGLQSPNPNTFKVQVLNGKFQILSQSRDSQSD